MIKKLIFCIGLSIFAIGIVYILFFLSRVPSNRSNHFTRKLPPHVLTDIGGLVWQNNPWRLAGNDDSAFYLAHRGLLNIVMRVGKNNLDTTITSICLATNASPEFLNSAWLLVDADAFYLADGKKGQLYRGHINSRVAQLMDTNMAFFDKLIINNDKIYFRGIDPNKGFVLGKRNAVSKQQTIFSDLLEHTPDGLFAQDGFLLGDRHQTLVYLYRYCNRFIVMDTSMRLLYKGRTIDTTAHVQLQLGATDKGREIKIATPPPTVNQDACTANEYLFVKSALRADNELSDLTKDAAVVDVYDLRQGNYKVSFYVPDYNHEKMQQFLISGNRLAAMYLHQLRIFKMEQKYLLTK
jgi:hypothetical protein